MCGIYGITSNNNDVSQRVFRGLEALEYRGYDSWGLAVRDAGSGLNTVRQVGKISDASLDTMPGSEGLGHTRWATHGEVSETNTHPHRSGRVTLVHNGIVENHQELREKLAEHGYKFVSQTDSEVLAAWIDWQFASDSNHLEALARVEEGIRGRSAAVFVHDTYEGIFAFSTGLPLVVSAREEETAIASDPLAFEGEDDQVVYLDSRQAGYFHKNNREYYALEEQSHFVPVYETLSLEAKQSLEGTHVYHMLSEILEQGDLTSQALSQEAVITNLAQQITKAEQVYLIGCGTAHKVAMLGAYYLRTIGIDAQAIVASETDEYHALADADTLCIAISQSGETADVLSGVEAMQAQGASVAAVVNVAHSSLARRADTVVDIQAGVEQAVASTKAAMNQIAVLYQAAAYTSQTLPPIDKEKLHKSLAALMSPSTQTSMESLACFLDSITELFLIGSGPYYPVALEGAIKIAEVSYINAVGFATGELKHGPLALIQEGVVCVVLGSKSRDLRAASQLRARGAYVIGIAPSSREEFDVHIPTQESEPYALAGSLVALQLFSYYLSISRGINPDRPRNLAKSVTVQ